MSSVILKKGKLEFEEILRNDGNNTISIDFFKVHSNEIPPAARNEITSFLS